MIFRLLIDIYHSNVVCLDFHLYAYLNLVLPSGYKLIFAEFDSGSYFSFVPFASSGRSAAVPCFSDTTD